MKSICPGSIVLTCNSSVFPTRKKDVLQLNFSQTHMPYLTALGCTSKVPELFQHFIQDQPYDSSVYPIIAEHKLLIRSFIHYLGDHGHLRRSVDIIAMYEEVVKLAQVIKLNMLKYEISGKDKHRYIPHVIKSIAEMAFQEKACMERIIAELY